MLMADQLTFLKVSDAIHWPPEGHLSHLSAPMGVLDSTTNVYIDRGLILLYLVAQWNGSFNKQVFWWSASITLDNNNDVLTNI